MKQLAYKTLLFIALFSIIDSLVFYIYKHEEFNKPYSYGSLSKLYAGTINADVVIFGSSRTQLHINPMIIEELTGLTSYNLAQAGTNIFQSFFTLEEYMLHNKKPKIVIFEADIRQLDKKILLRFEKHNFKKYIFLSRHTAELFNQTLLEKISHSLIKSQCATNNPYIFYHYFSKSIWNKRQEEQSVVDNNDWVFSKGAHLKKGIDPTRGINPQKEEYHIDLSSDREELFRRLLRYAEQQRFILLLFSPPSILSWEKNKSMESAIEFYRNLSSKSNSIYYADYSFDDDLRKNKSLWFNGAHLNIVGANLLTKKITTHIQLIDWIVRSQEKMKELDNF